MNIWPLKLISVLINICAMDYSGIREIAQAREQEIRRRLFEVENERARLASEADKLANELYKVIRFLESPAHRSERGRRGLGLTEHVRTLLSQSRKALTPTEIRDSCVNAGLRASTRRNLLITVHNTLRRMELHREIKKTKWDGKDAYIGRWSERRRSRGSRGASR